jgi:hypothetical protein
MRNRLFPAAALSLSIIACSGQLSSTEIVNDDGLRNFTGARVQLTEEGGIAAFFTAHLVRHDDRYFSVVRRRICLPPNCGAPLDTAAGTLSPAATDSLFNIVLAQASSLETDYGVTPNGADMITYTLQITKGSTAKTIRADDGTMPPPMRRIVEAVHGIVSAARQ